MALLAAAFTLLGSCGEPSAPPAPPTPGSPAPSLSPSPEPAPETASPPPASPEVRAAPTLPEPERDAARMLGSAFSYQGLVSLEELDAGFLFDIRYATEDNFTGTVLYDRALCLVHRDVARRLLRVQELAAESGYRLLIFDAYRPVQVQQTMYDLTPEGKKRYVSQPGPKANHTKGIAVDCTLADADGIPLDMPSDFDEFSARAATAYAGGTAGQRANRDMLIALMREAGMRPVSGEWWHFIPEDTSGYEVLDVEFWAFVQAREALPGLKDLTAD